MTYTLPQTPNEFVEQFRHTTSGATEHDRVAKRRKTAIDAAGTDVTLIRYAIGGDDNLYAQLGMSLLRGTKDDNELPLAPDALYSAAALDAIRHGMAAEAKAHAEERRVKGASPAFVKAVNHRLKETFFKIQEVQDALKKGFEGRPLPHDENGLNNASPRDVVLVLTKLRDVLHEENYASLYAKLFADTRAKELQAEKKDKEENAAELKSATEAAEAELKSATENAAKAATKKPEKLDEALLRFRRQRELRESIKGPTGGEWLPSSAAAVVDYALARGLCGHRGPHEAATASPTDALLPYEAPADLARALARARHLDLPEGGVGRSQSTAAGVDQFVLDEVDVALGGDLAIDSATPGAGEGGVVRAARQVRWEPIGTHAVALATAAAFEHVVARCKLLADDATLSDAARHHLLSAAAHFKLAQLDSLYEISCAMDDGEELPLATDATLVTRPVAFMRGRLHLAHDGGHHPAPQATHVAEHARWTASDARANVEFRKGAPTGIYMAPPPEHLGYVPFHFGAPAHAPTPPIEPHDGIDGLLRVGLERIVEHALYYLDVPTNAAIEKQHSVAAGASGGAIDRRSGIYNEFLREAAISTDRVWSFVKTVSGLIGEDATSLIVTTEERSTAAAKELQKQQRATAERVATFQAKLVELVIAGVLKDSKLRLDTNRDSAGAVDAAADSLVVINAETAKQVNDLASGASGRPFFEANVALRNLVDRSRGGTQRLGDVVTEIATIAGSLRIALDAGASAVGGGPTLAEISLPRNCLFIKLREDAAAALRSAFDKLTVELAVAGVRRISLFELVEGADHTLTSRWADFVGHVLIQNRTSTGVSALYVGRGQLVVNAAQAHVSLRRLILHARSYATGTAPAFLNEDANNEKLVAARNAYFEAHHSNSSASYAKGVALESMMNAQLRWQRTSLNTPDTAPAAWKGGLLY
mgnify:CR=1 FL=1